MVHHDFINRKLLEKCKAQEDFEIIAKILKPNNIGVVTHGPLGANKEY